MQTWYLSAITITALFLWTTFRFVERAFKDNSGNTLLESEVGDNSLEKTSVYNSTYPITKSEADGDKIVFKIAIISDMDKLSATVSNTWRSLYKKGTLTWDKTSEKVDVVWDEEDRDLKSKYSYSGRGMELSELVTFNGKLFSPDDRTGIVYLIENGNFYPWVMLLDGPGNINKGFKSEWATVKDEHLYVGSSGMEWVTNGTIDNYNAMWVKRVNRYGNKTNINWQNNYEALRKKLKVTYPGYMWHEAVVWSDIHKKWFFLPRKMSRKAYDSKKDEKKGTNKLLITSDFKDIKVIIVGEKNPEHGFSSFKFIPNTEDKVIVALKSVEVGNLAETYILAFTIDGKTLLDEMKVGDIKYEECDSTR
ncbi:apyrase-like isoform X2 [Rhodnius prolixus]|uniref:apyrase-like isoform X2 n=1 Tax=Rhodnius prolixus TaxID=13249 RepID=UPI003D187AC3